MGASRGRAPARAKLAQAVHLDRHRCLARLFCVRALVVHQVSALVPLPARCCILHGDFTKLIACITMH